MSTERGEAKRFGRRAFLGGLSAGAAGAALVASSNGLGPGRAAAAVRRAASIDPAGSDLGAIEHVVMLMQENRSFDHYFGVRPGVRGFDDHARGSLGVFAQAWPQNTTKPPTRRLLPFHLDTSDSRAECTFDLSHQWTAQHECWNHGAMDSFVTTHTSPDWEGPQGVVTMGYYTREDLPFYYALMDAFTLCDGYHCSVLGPTDPNRLYFWSGTLDPAGTAGGPILATSEDEASKWTTSWTTMPEVLENYGVSWKVYNPPGTAYQPNGPISKLVSNNSLLYFSQYQNPTTSLHDKAFNFTFPSDFTRDVAAGTLPQVSWLVAPTLPADMSEHPPAPAARGEYFTHKTLKILASNPKVWSKTVFFVCYDENDGFFDHVPPPTPPTGTQGEYLTVNPLPSAAGGIDGPIGLGIRVPLMVLSPFSRGGRVVSETFDHTSHLRFLETRFGTPVPNVSPWRRSTVGDLSSTLLPRGSSSGLPALPATSFTPRAVSGECAVPQLIEQEAPGAAPYPVPAVQQMPTQTD